MTLGSIPILGIDSVPPGAGKLGATMRIALYCSILHAVELGMAVQRLCPASAGGRASSLCCSVI